MASALVIPVGVAVAREKISHPWQSHRWRVVNVFLNAPRINSWTELRRDDRSVVYHAATLNLELHRKETTAYRVNLANGDPTIYVVLREDPESDGDWPVDVHLVTASPFEAQSKCALELGTVACEWTVSVLGVSAGSSGALAPRNRNLDMKLSALSRVMRVTSTAV